MAFVAAAASSSQAHFPWLATDDEGRAILGRMAARLSFDLAARRGRFCAVPPAATA